MVVGAGDANDKVALSEEDEKRKHLITRDLQVFFWAVFTYIVCCDVSVFVLGNSRT